MNSVAPTPGWTENPLDGEVFAEPLIYNGVVYAATLQNTVYAINQSDGSLIWHKNVGNPQTGGWTCGNINPTGILGTPVIDTSANRIYVVAEITGTTPTYHLFGLDLANLGNIVLDTAIAPPGFDWRIQQERGALALANGRVYVPFGGRIGDCGQYSGWVVGVHTDGTTSLDVYQTAGFGSGLWSAGGVAVDSSGNVYGATGNGVAGGCAAVDQNDAVVRLSSTLALQDWFMPLDWQNNWCINDQDLGSAGPVLIGSNLLFQAGKRGGGFLLNPNSLGHVNGQLFPVPSPYSQANVCHNNLSDATFGSFAYSTPYVYVECEGHGLVALNVNTTTPSFTTCGACAAPDWSAGGSNTFGPPIVAAGAVWVANDNGLFAFNAFSGALIYQSAPFGVNRFVTPAEAGGQVFVPSHTVIKAFSFAGSVTVTPAHLDFNGQPPTTTSAPQMVTFHNNTAATVNITTAAITGANAPNYIKGTDTCSGQPILSGATCGVAVSFKPGAFGGFPANLTFTDNGPGSPQTIQMNGMGALDNQNHLYTLDGYGGVHADGSAPSLATTAYWAYWDIARSIALFPDGQGGYVMDGFGGLHNFGNANPVAGSAYWAYWDIARQVVLAPWSSQASPAGWTLDGYGGIHPFGGAPAISGFAYWAGWDIARGIVILPDSTPSSVAGYTMDGYGGIHPFGGAPAINGFAYWAGWDIARGITLLPTASKTNPAGFTVDGYGGIHPFGSAPSLSGSAYWAYWDIARGIVAWTGSGGTGGWVMDGYGGMHPFGSAPAISSFAYWPGWDIANSFTGCTFGSSSRHK